jgi:hypothetical protein
MLIIKSKLNKNKNFFFFKFKFIFLNYKYLGFYDYNKLNYENTLKVLIKKNKLGHVIVQSNDLISLFSTNYVLFFFKNSYILLYFNDFNTFVNYKKDLQNGCLLALLFCGYFVNSKYFSKINIYYYFYNNNFNIYIYLIFNIIKTYIFIIYIFILKLLIIVLKFFKFKLIN